MKQQILLDHKYLYQYNIPNKNFYINSDNSGLWCNTDQCLLASAWAIWGNKWTILHTVVVCINRVFRE